MRAGAIGNRQLGIYDKRAEVIQKHKAGWPVIWNHTRSERGEPTLDLSDANTSRIWRFELRLGSKQLRGRWEIRSWNDLDVMIGDAFTEFCQERMRYAVPQADRNRSRWPTHELWSVVQHVIAGDLASMRSGAEPVTVKEANREEHKRMLDAMILGNLVSRAAAEGVPVADTHDFIKAYIPALIQKSREHPIPIDERRTKADARYRWR